METAVAGEPVFSKTLLQGKTLLIVTNREPYVHSYDNGGDIQCAVPAGGVTAAMDPIMQEVGGTWIAWGSGNADDFMSDARGRVRVPPSRPQYTLKRVRLSPAEVQKFYYGYCNEGLWPLSHGLISKVRFEKSWWHAYRRVNQKFAAAVLDQAGADDIVWIHDYHLTLLPQMLKKANPRLAVVFFWHIPWPQYDAFRICPEHKAILDGLMACDLLGFHIPRYGRNFLECAERSFGAARLRTKKIPRVASFPISIDVRDIEAVANSKRVETRMVQLRKRYNLDGRLVGCGVERLDYTKGIPERLEALEMLFERHPEFREKFTFLQLCSPSRGEISEYRSIKASVVAITERINSKFGTINWTPVVVFHKKVPFEQIIAMYRMADVAVVSPLVDGMNLVAKEFIAAQVDEKGVLVLSEFAGAAGSLTNVIKCNPFERDSFAEHIREALEMPEEARRAMIRLAREEVRSHTVFDWMDTFLTSAADVAHDTRTPGHEA